MVTSKTTLEAAESIKDLNKVRQVQSADRGYIIVSFEDLEAVKEVTRVLNEHSFHMFDATHNWLSDNKECNAIHYKHPDRDKL